MGLLKVYSTQVEYGRGVNPNEFYNGGLRGMKVVLNT